MLEERPLKNVLVLFFTSDRALCGSFNSHLFKAAAQQVQAIHTLAPSANVDFVAVGSKGQQFLVRTGNKVAAAFPALSNNPHFRSILPIARLALEGFLNGTYDRVVLVYSDFVSALVQEPAAKVLLPFSEKELREMTQGMGDHGHHHKADHSEVGEAMHASEYKFEPSASEVLDRILPQLTELQIYQAALENAASEHSARMIAMRNASDNATDLIADLTLTYNQTRQGIITAELAELSASKAALD
jgi:F-type H+-transporting ATPase subunit gamma